MKRIIVLSLLLGAMMISSLDILASGDPALDINLGPDTLGKCWVNLDVYRAIKISQISLALNWRDFKKLTLWDGQNQLAEVITLKSRTVLNPKAPLLIERGVKKMEIRGDNSQAVMSISFIELMILEDGRASTYVLDLTSTDIARCLGKKSSAWGAIKRWK